MRRIVSPAMGRNNKNLHLCGLRAPASVPSVLNPFLVGPNCRLRRCRGTSKNRALRVSYSLQLRQSWVPYFSRRALGPSRPERQRTAEGHSHDAEHRYSIDWGTQSSQPAHAYARSVFNGDRKSTRLNSSHANISYAVFCLKKKKINTSSCTLPRSDMAATDSCDPYPNGVPD